MWIVPRRHGEPDPRCPFSLATRLRPELKHADSWRDPIFRCREDGGGRCSNLSVEKESAAQAAVVAAACGSQRTQSPALLSALSCRETGERRISAVAPLRTYANDWNPDEVGEQRPFSICVANAYPRQKRPLLGRARGPPICGLVFFRVGGLFDAARTAVYRITNRLRGFHNPFTPLGPRLPRRQYRPIPSPLGAPRLPWCRGPSRWQH